VAILRNFTRVKSIVTIALLVLYSFASFGATVSQHFCMNQYVGATIEHLGHFEQTANACGKCGMTEDATKNGCCKTKTVQVKLEQSQKAVDGFLFKLFTDVAILPQSSFGAEHAVSILPIPVNKPTYYSSPPDKQGEPLYLIFCTYLI
jgi:hypothetical protein